MKKVLFGILVFLLLVGCSNSPVCNKPYILVGTSCCLDQNNNQICDSDEVKKASSSELTISENSAKQTNVPSEIFKQADNLEVNENLETIVSGDPTCVSLGCPKGTSFVGSVNSDKYHFCSCTYAKKIFKTNLVCFVDSDDARSQRYVPGGRCKPS